MTRLRVLVTGRHGQLVNALIERGADHGLDVIGLGRPDIDLQQPLGITAKIRDFAPDVVVNAAGHTAVDQAESEPQIVHAVNVTGAGAIAEAAKSLNIAIVQISTDFVFDGSQERPYREDDATAPLNVYGKSKLASEALVASITPNHAILRTSWVYSPFGKNFVKTMLAFGKTRSEISVVCDQIGAPTYAIDLADGIIRLSRNLVEYPDAEKLRGVLHLTASGVTSWADFAAAIFADVSRRGGPGTRVQPIPSSAYATAARRPSNSRLDNAKIASIHGVRLPDWRDGLSRCLDRLAPFH